MTAPSTTMEQSRTRREVCLQMRCAQSAAVSCLSNQHISVPLHLPPGAPELWAQRDGSIIPGGPQFLLFSPCQHQAAQVFGLMSSGEECGMLQWKCPSAVTLGTQVVHQQSVGFLGEVMCCCHICATCHRPPPRNEAPSLGYKECTSF